MTMDNKQYLPPDSNTFIGRIRNLRAWAAYRHWQKRLSKLIGQDRISMLECGCGPGFLSKNIKQWFPNITATLTDYEYVLLQRARAETNSVVIQCDAETLPLESASFDLVISFHMIEHLVDPKHFIDEAYRVLKPNGYFIYATPNPDGLPARILKQKWSGIREDHIALHTPTEWYSMTTKGGFKLLEEGTTTLSGLSFLKLPPFNLINNGLLFIFGFFPWKLGESYTGIYQKDGGENNSNAANLLNINTMERIGYNELVDRYSNPEQVSDFQASIKDVLDRNTITTQFDTLSFYLCSSGESAYIIVDEIPLLSTKFKISLTPNLVTSTSRQK